MSVFLESYKSIDTFLIIVETEHGVAKAILKSVIDFRRDPWPKVSQNAKDLIKKMLHPDPKRRLTAQQVLGIISTFKCIIVFSSLYEINVMTQIIFGLQIIRGYRMVRMLPTYH